MPAGANAPIDPQVEDFHAEGGDSDEESDEYEVETEEDWYEVGEEDVEEGNVPVFTTATTTTTTTTNEVDSVMEETVATEFNADWRPILPGSGFAGGPGSPYGPHDAPPPQLRPAWRTVPPAGRRRIKRQGHAQSPRDVPAPLDPIQQISSWATWQPDPELQPSPSTSVERNVAVPGRVSAGLFGPRSPTSSIMDEPSPSGSPEPSSVAPSRSSPGLFGPRSPR